MNPDQRVLAGFLDDVALHGVGALARAQQHRRRQGGSHTDGCAIACAVRAIEQQILAGVLERIRQALVP